MIKIAICICTRKRQEGLKRLLHSFEKMQKPSDTEVRIILVENDIENFSESIIKEFSSNSKFKISYYLESRQGLTFARNRSVKEANGSDFCCFVDDDQIVASDWLFELVRCQREFDSDGVWGANSTIFNKIAPSYIKQFYNCKKYNYGTIVNRASTNCLLLRKKSIDKINGPFDARLNFTGGEDSNLTYLITKMGGAIRYNPDAIAYEIISESRATINYIIKRTIRISNTSLYVVSLEDINFSKLRVLPRLILRMIKGLLIVIPFLIFGKSNKLIGVILICRAIGGFSFLLGRTNQFYR